MRQPCRPTFKVSIHTRHYWRVKPWPRPRGFRRAGVSIHTRHYWRVKPERIELDYRAGVFQSTPAITGG